MLHFVYHLGRRIRAHYADSDRDRDRPIRNPTWDYPTEGPHDDPPAEAVLREINGYDLAAGRLVNGFGELKADGSTSSGCWISAGCFAGGVNQTHRREAWVEAGRASATDDEAAALTARTRPADRRP